MLTTQPITQIIPQRFSVRMYQDRPIAEETQKDLQARLDAIRQGPFGSPVRLELAAAGPDDAKALRGLGTYGTIQNPPGFIVGTVKTGKQDMEDFGYAMEEAILAATGLGLGTCWLGGFFNQSGFAKAIRKQEDELLPAVAAVGYTLEDVKMRDRSRLRVLADLRLPWEDLFFEGGFGRPLSRLAAGRYQQALEMVRLGPSASNKQPWRVIRDGAKWHFYCQRTPGYGKGSLMFAVLHIADLQRVDLGIALCHFELTARDGGLGGGWKINDPGLPLVDKNTLYVATWDEG